MVTRRALLGTAALLAAPAVARAQAVPFRVGVLNDQSGVFSAATGPGSLVAAQMAAADFGGALNGRPIQVLVADHQNRPDVGSSLARQWFDLQGVEAILDLGNSAIALAVNQLAREKNKVVLISGAGATALTGAACLPNLVQWTYDTWSTASALARALAEEGRRSWFFITADYAFGHSLQSVVTQTVETLGGLVLGAARHPLPTDDFSSLLTRARQSGADVVGLANGGADTIRAIKQAYEFRVTPRQAIVGLSAMIGDVDAVGLQQAQGLLLCESFYWDMNDGTRAFARRWAQQNAGAMPNMMQAGVYSVLLHYLRAQQGAADLSDGAAAVRRMKAQAIDDTLFGRGAIRADGRAMLDFHVFRAKSPAQSRGPWDYYDLVRTIPAAQATRPPEHDACPLLVSLPGAMGVPAR